MAVNEEERFSQTLALARQLSTELDLEYFNSDPKRLNLKEALYLISTKHRLPKVSIPPTLATFPWRVPSTAKGISPDKLNKINQILEQSLRIQMGVIPSTEFDKHILSNACMAVCGLLHVYLKAIDISSSIGKYIFILTKY